MLGIGTNTPLPEHYEGALAILAHRRPFKKIGIGEGSAAFSLPHNGACGPHRQTFLPTPPSILSCYASWALLLTFFF